MASDGRISLKWLHFLNFPSALTVLLATGLSVAACAETAVPSRAPLGFTVAAADADRTGEGGVVAVAEPQAAAAGARVLAAGGNAIDAAAVVQFMLNVTEPQASGIGGGGFALIYLATSNETVALDFRETAPAGVFPQMFANSGADDASGRFAVASTSGQAVGVPGTVMGIARALELWGTITFADALQPAITAAEDGIIVGRHLRQSLEDAIAPASGGTSMGRLAHERGNPAYDEARRVFAPGGKPIAVGERMRQPLLARSLRLLAEEGPDAFYECSSAAGIARAIVLAQRATRSQNPSGGGTMTCADLTGYEAIVREPLSGRYRGYLIKTLPPPSAGGIALLQMLAMLQRFPLGDAATSFGWGRYATLNLMQEAMRLAAADRMRWIGDPEFGAVPATGLLAPEYLKGRAASCPDADPAQGRYCLAIGARIAGVGAGDPQFETHTTHFTIADRFGNIVAWTGTIESPWGTGLMVPGFGFLLNNELTDFNLLPRRSETDPGINDAGPGKRPRSSIAPTIIFSPGPSGPQPIAALGSPGGATIPNSVLNVVLNLIDHRLPLQEAIEAPRLSLTDPGDDAVTIVEPGFDEAVLARLSVTCSGGGNGEAAPRCYRFRRTDAIGSVQAVAIDRATGRRAGGADPRRDGTVFVLSPFCFSTISQERLAWAQGRAMPACLTDGQIKGRRHAAPHFPQARTGSASFPGLPLGFLQRGAHG